MLSESLTTGQTSYVAGTIGVSLNRVHIERKHYLLFDLLAYCGGLILAIYLLFYIVLYSYQKVERKIYLIKNIFYFAEKTEAKVLDQNLNF